MIYKANETTMEKLFPMFSSMKATMILSCLQGHMGSAWVDNIENPIVAQIVIGIFVFYAGDPNAIATEELLLNLPEYTLIIVNTDEWKKRIETFYKGHIEKFQRYAFKKDSKDLDCQHIRGFLKTLPEGYELKRLDASLAKESSFNELSEDFISQFNSMDDFINRGVGFSISYSNQIVCGGTSYSIYDNGIEIEIATHPLHRKKGLATIVASELILYCLERGTYPSWDAANIESVKLAEKLGYVLEGAYDTYYIDGKYNCIQERLHLV